VSRSLKGGSIDNSRPPDDRRAVSCVTWNLHRGRGHRSNGAVDVERVFAALEQEVMQVAPAILALQEADEEEPPHRGIFDPARIEAITGLRHAQAEPLRWSAHSHGFLGSVFYLRPDIQIVDAGLVDLPGHAHRGAVILDVRLEGSEFRIATAHLSLLQILRVAQMRTLGQNLARRRSLPTFLMGDLNEWRPWGGLAFGPAVTGLDLRGPVVGTFPISRPLLPLDRIMADRPNAISQARALDGPLIGIASDHRPLAAMLAV
jgi:endonuclease/exonuclease/phosphatase family metal-dependent hydrolase